MHNKYFHIYKKILKKNEVLTGENSKQIKFSLFKLIERNVNSFISPAYSGVSR